jgi:hypothetical protein
MAKHNQSKSACSLPVPKVCSFRAAPYSSLAQAWDRTGRSHCCKKSTKGTRVSAISRSWPQPNKQRLFNQKEKHLRTCGVLPLWYHADTHEEHTLQVEKLVESIVERISVRTLKVATTESKGAHIPARPPQASTPPMPELDAHFERVVRLIEDGRLTFFLGSAIHDWPTRIKPFYECEALSVEPFAVAQYIADRHGRENLYAQVRKLFARTPLVPRSTHELFAAWSGFRTHRGKNVPFPMVITTNYDDVRGCFRAHI